jgi:hypothetical protein
VNRDIFQAVYDVTIIYEGKDGLVMAPDMFGMCDIIIVIV